jgi:hypothetical protein
MGMQYGKRKDNMFTERQISSIKSGLIVLCEIHSGKIYRGEQQELKYRPEDSSYHNRCLEECRDALRAVKELK